MSARRGSETLAATTVTSAPRVASGLGEREAHPTRRTVADVAHAVDRLARASGRDEHAQPGESAASPLGGTEHRLAGGEQGDRLGEAPGPPLAAGGEAAGLRLHDRQAPRAQRSDVGLRGRVVPHAVVHGRGDDHRARRGEGGAGQQVVGEATGQLRERVRGRRRDEVHVGVGHELEVAERIVGRGRVAREGPAGRIALELVDEDRRAAQRRERRAPDEALARRRLHDAHGVPGAGRQAHELERLVGGDAAAHSEQDPGHRIVTVSGTPTHDKGWWRLRRRA